MDNDERRGGPRLDLRLRVKFAQGLYPEAEATDISPGGARLESRVPIEADTKLNLELDAGDGETVDAVGTVCWCRPRKGVSLRKLYDIGIRFDSEWLAARRGKLGRALGRIFSFSEFEPARAYDRVLVTLRAESVDGKDLRLHVVDISEGGMQFRSEGPLGTAIYIGAPVIVEIPGDTDGISVDGEVVWVAEQDESQASIYSSFGVRFSDPGIRELEVLRSIKDGESTPRALSLFLPG